MATHKDVDLVVSAIAGSPGLVPTMAAIEAGKSVGLASKEPIVMAGRLLMAEARKRIPNLNLIIAGSDIHSMGDFYRKMISDAFAGGKGQLEK